MVEAVLVVIFVLMAAALVLLVGGVAAATIGMVFDVESRDALRRFGGFAARLSAPRRRANDLEMRLGQLEAYEGSWSGSCAAYPETTPTERSSRVTWSKCGSCGAPPWKRCTTPPSRR